MHWEILLGCSWFITVVQRSCFSICFTAGSEFASQSHSSTVFPGQSIIFSPLSRQNPTTCFWCAKRSFSFWEEAIDCREAPDMFYEISASGMDFTIPSLFWTNTFGGARIQYVACTTGGCGWMLCHFQHQIPLECIVTADSGRQILIERPLKLWQ